MYSRWTTWVCVAVALFLTPGHVVGQHENHPMSASPLVAQLVDGSKTPELIPDEAAIQMFILSLAAPDNGTPAQDARIRAAVMRSDLREGDIQIVKGKISEVHAQMRTLVTGIEDIHRRMGTNPPTAARQDLVNQHTQIRTLALATYNGMLASLSGEGAGKLRQHIQYVKTRIKLIPPPPM